MIFLRILRAVCWIALMAGGHWLAMYHHHDATFRQFALIMIPVSIITLSDWLLTKSRA